MPGGLALAQAAGTGPYIDPDFRQLNTWIIIHPDDTATFFVGKTDLGQGTGTAFRQIMGDELDMAYARTRLVMGTTDIARSGRLGRLRRHQTDGWPMRRVAAGKTAATRRIGQPSRWMASEPPEPP